MNKLRNPLSALCAALALWTLGVFGLSLLGLGAGLAPYPDDSAQAPDLPNVRLAKSASRLGPVTDYVEVGQRPLLTPDRRPSAQADSSEAEAAPLDATLSSVLISGDLKLAILQDNTGGGNRRVRLGELLEGSQWRLQSLEPRRAVFVGPLGEKTLDLRVFDGRGGAEPTPVTSTAKNESSINRGAPAGGKAGANSSAPPPGKVDDQAGNPQNPAATDASDQQAQVEAIRRRIEARRAQLRADAAKKIEKKVD